MVNSEYTEQIFYNLPMHTTTDPLTHDDDSNDDKVCKNITMSKHLGIGHGQWHS